MKIFSKIKRFFNLSLTNPKSWDKSLWNLKGSQSLSGENVTEDTAMTYSAVWNAVYQISSTMGSLPLHFMKKTGRNKDIALNKSLYHVLHTRYNQFMTAKIGRECMMSHILLYGNGYAEVVRNGYGDVTQLWPIPPTRVTDIIMGEDNNLWYEINLKTEKKWLPRGVIMHIPGLGFDGFTGYSPIAMARKNIGLGMAMETFSSNYFGQGTHPGVVVSHPGKLDSQTHNNLKNSLTDSYSGLGQAHRLMLLEDAMKIEKISFSPEDSQFLESKQHHISDIARWFNMPPHKLKDMTKSSFNNIEAENASYVIDTILPWAVHLEQSYATQLISETERQQGYYFKHVLEGLLRANSKDRAEYYRTMIGTGIMTLNDARDKEDLNPVDVPYADELWMPTGLIPISRFDEYLSKNNKTKAIEDEDEEPESKVLRLIQSQKEVIQ